MKRGWISESERNNTYKWSYIVAGAATMICVLNNTVHSVPVPDTKGTRFVFSTPFCFEDSSSKLLVIPQTTETVNVTIVNLVDNSELSKHTIPTDESLQHSIPCTTFQWEQTMTSGILLTSTGEVSVHVHSKEDNFILFPEDTVGTNYVLTNFITSLLSETFVIMHGNDSQVQLTLPSTSHVTVNNQQYSNGATVNLALPVNGMLGINCSCDLTGAIINSSRPISVFVGSYGSDATNGVMEQVLPTTSWGKRFIFSMSSWFASNVTIKISGSKLNTMLSVKTKDTSEAPTFASSSPHLTMQLSVNDFLSIESNETVTCAVLYEIRDESNTYHVTMKFVPPIELYHISHMFTLSTTDAFYSNIITHSESFQYITFDSYNGHPFNGAMTFFWDFYLRQDLHVSNPHNIRTNTLNKMPFMGSVITLSPTSAYEYYLGMRITNLYDACVETHIAHGGNGDGKDNDCDNRIDEEILNKVDDDKDGLIDEDVEYFGKTSNSGMDAWTYHQTHKEEEKVFSTSFLSVIISIVVALTSVAVFIIGMLIAEKVRRSGSTRITPIYLEQQHEPILQRY